MHTLFLFVFTQARFLSIKGLKYIHKDYNHYPARLRKTQSSCLDTSRGKPATDSQNPRHNGQGNKLYSLVPIYKNTTHSQNPKHNCQGNRLYPLAPIMRPVHGEADTTYT